MWEVFVSEMCESPIREGARADEYFVDQWRLRRNLGRWPTQWLNPSAAGAAAPRGARNCSFYFFIRIAQRARARAIRIASRAAAKPTRAGAESLNVTGRQAGPQSGHCRIFIGQRIEPTVGPTIEPTVGSTIGQKLVNLLTKVGLMAGLDWALNPSEIAK